MVKFAKVIGLGLAAFFGGIYKFFAARSTQPEQRPREDASCSLLLSGPQVGQARHHRRHMLLSLAVYAMIWGWRYAAGFVGLMFVHEMGHYVAARQCGLNVGAPTFIPFVGAWITLKEQPHDVETEAYVAVAGPLVGTDRRARGVSVRGGSSTAACCWRSPMRGLFLNLFNLLPLSPLDGGRITAIISPRIWLLGAPMMLALTLYRPSPVLHPDRAIFSLPQIMKAWRYDPNAPENVAYYGVRAQTKLEYGAAYLALTGFLCVITFEVHEMLSGMRPAP